MNNLKLIPLSSINIITLDKYRMTLSPADCVKFGYAPRKKCDTCQKKCHPNDIKHCCVDNCSNNFCIDCAVTFRSKIICPAKHPYVQCDYQKHENTEIEYCDCNNYLDFEYSFQELTSNLCSCGKPISF